MTRNEALERFVNSDPLQAAWIINEIFDDFEKMRCENCNNWNKKVKGCETQGMPFYTCPEWFCADFKERQ
jgi:hypothetical protein